MDVWSNTDFPYQCLRDTARTLALRKAINAVVKQGDVVLDIGAGSGINAFFAAEAGAARVYAVEVDPFLASLLMRSVKANNLEGVIEVIHGDACSVTLPETAQVCICELIETGLLDEMQATVVNALRQRRVIHEETRMLPVAYETFIELGQTSFEYYGYKIFAPKHDWPYYERDRTGWLPSEFTPLSSRHLLSRIDFTQHVEREVAVTIAIPVHASGVCNAVRLSSRAYLTDDMSIGATNAINGDKILHVEPLGIRHEGVVSTLVSYVMSGGLASLRVELSANMHRGQERAGDA